jgi:hypothetical protein
MPPKKDVLALNRTHAAFVRAVMPDCHDRVTNAPSWRTGGLSDIMLINSMGS